MPKDHHNAVPQLLVSVRSAAEAQAALVGGGDIIDVKEPNRGSLGMADPDTIAQIVATVESQRAKRRPPVSVALGETIDWLDAACSLPAGVRFAKLGTAGLAARKAWEHDWRQVQEAFDKKATPPLEWVAVVYADWPAARAPEPANLIAAAARAGCRVVLFDTWQKSGATLLDWISPSELRQHLAVIREHGMRAALAGGLTASLLPQVVPLAADILGIRTAACRDADRTAEICESAVRSFKSAMERPCRRTPLSAGWPALD